MEKLTLTVVTPERAVLDKIACDSVTLPAEGGEIGILPRHTPLITLLGIGAVTAREGARKTTVAVRGGFAEIAADQVRVLADQAQALADVDVSLATRDRDEAERNRMAVVGEEQLDAVNADLRYAEARIAISREK